MKSQGPRVGLALGSGSARGWAHIGVIRALEKAGIPIDVVCGSSIGALVGAAYAAGELDGFEQWARRLSWRAVVSLLDLKMDGGVMEGRKLVDFFRARFADPGIDKLPKPFACVATDLVTGREVWLREGAVIDAVRASIALPGLFTPAVREGRRLLDGGLVNPVPVSLCRAMGADIVIAVDLNWNLLGRRRHGEVKTALRQFEAGLVENRIIDRFRARFDPTRYVPRMLEASPGVPSMLEVLAIGLNIMQVRITQSRLAGEPADALIRPHLPSISAMDFHRAELSIEEGMRATEQALPMIHDMLR